MLNFAKDGFMYFAIDVDTIWCEMGPQKKEQGSGKEVSGPQKRKPRMMRPERDNAATLLEFTTVKPFIFSKGIFTCFYCCETYTDVNSVLQHTGVHTPNRFVLKECVRKIRETIKVDISELKCSICDLVYSDIDDIREHLTTTHEKIFAAGGNGLLPYILNTTNNLITCHKCEKVFTSFYKLNSHMSDHSGMICETCGRGFSTQNKLRIHSMIHQNSTYKCDKCDVVCTSVRRFKYHLIRYHETDIKKAMPSKCPHCSERFSDHYKKIAHLKQAHGISLTFQCATCNTFFPSRRRLTEHTTKYHIQNIKCKICEKCFVSSTLLRYHMREHIGERNFVCAICQKAYMHETKLRRHINVNHGFRFVCFKCGEGFPEKDDLIKHKKERHSEKNKVA